mgnify:CR=1 FL=1
MLINISKGIPRTKKYLAVMTTGKVLATNPLSINICGYEEIKLKNSDTESRVYDEGSLSSSLSIKDNFENSEEVECPISKYSLISSSFVSLSTTESQSVSINEDNLLINKETSAVFDFFVVATTVSG